MKLLAHLFVFVAFFAVSCELGLEPLTLPTIDDSDAQSDALDLLDESAPYDLGEDQGDVPRDLPEEDVETDSPLDRDDDLLSDLLLDHDDDKEEGDWEDGDAPLDQKADQSDQSSSCESLGCEGGCCEVAGAATCVALENDPTNCGACGRVCESGSCNLGVCCEDCSGLGVECGEVEDGCGGVLSCGQCTAPEICGGRAVGLCGSPYRIPDSATPYCISGSGEVPCSWVPTDFVGQDGHYLHSAPEILSTPDTGIVEESLTGLLWETDEKFIFQGASPCVAPARLPSMFELLSLIDYGDTSSGKLPPEFTTNFESITAAGSISYRLSDGSMSPAASTGVSFCVSGDFPQGFLQPFSPDVVEDLGTGLLWQTSTHAPATWSEALTLCEGLTLEGLDEWRLPSLKELYSLLLYSEGGGYQQVPEIVFSSQTVWSSTPAPTGQAKIRTFDLSGDSNIADPPDVHRYLCVHDGI